MCPNGSVTVPKELWVHMFIHTLGIVPQAWYIQEEVRRKTRDCDSLAEQFTSSFSFKYSDKWLAEAIYAIKRILFTLGKLWEGCIDERILHLFYESGYLEAMTCGKVNGDSEEDDLEGLGHLTFHETEGERDI